MALGGTIRNGYGETFYVACSKSYSLLGEASNSFPASFATKTEASRFVSKLGLTDIRILCHRFNFKDSQEIQRAIEKGRIKVYPVAGNDDADDKSTFLDRTVHSTARPIVQIRADIKLSLSQIIAQEKLEAAEIEKAHAKRRALEKIGAHAGRFATGLYSAAESLLIWMKDINDVVSTNQRLYRIMMAASAAQHSKESDRLTVFKQTLAAAEHKEIVEALGFDPALISSELLKEAYEITHLLYDDQLTRQILLQFAKDYIDAQHSLEISEFGGGAAFEIILTAIITFFTAGAGLAANAALKAKYLKPLEKLGKLLAELAQQLRKQPKPKTMRVRTSIGSSNREKIRSRKKVGKRDSGDHFDDGVMVKAITQPKNLEEAVSLLKAAGEDIKKHGYVPKYSDAELRAMASKGEVPKERFVVRFSTVPKDNTGPIGHMRDSGRHPLWMSTFDQVERADTDPRIIADVFGTHYDPGQNYVLYVVDLGEDFGTNGSDVFVPTFENMRRKLKTEFSDDLSPEMIDKVMTKQYSEAFKAHWKDFNDHLASQGKHWSKSFDTDEAKKFASTLPEKEQEAFVTRQKILSEIGAWEIFTGDGLTEMKSRPGKPGALETLEIQHHPEKVQDLIKQGKVVEIPLTHKQ